MPEKDSRQISSKDTQSDYFDEEDEISLKNLLLVLWNNRKTIIVLSLASVFIIAAVCALVYLSQEKHKVASLEFKLEFKGVEKNEYPNGLKFSTADILSGPVINKVYNENNLQKYIEFLDFKSSLMITQTNDLLKFLEYEYSATLSNKNLILSDRKNLEEEFLEKKKNALSPIYILLYSQNKGMASLPDSLIAKVLNDILIAWADLADRVKGANQYQISIVSRNILDKNELERQPNIIATNMLMTASKRISDDIEKLEEIPGVKMISIGENSITLQDIKFRIEDIQRIKLGPAIGIIRQYGVSNKKELIATKGYIDNQIFELNLRKEQLGADVAVYENSLNQYVQKASGAMANTRGFSGAAPSPQEGMAGNIPVTIGETFLDSLIAMVQAQEESDRTFRQKITEKIIQLGLAKTEIDYEIGFFNELYESINSKQSEDSESKERIASLHKEVYQILIQTIDELNTLYLELSKYNLNPESLFYSVTSPVISNIERPLALKKILSFAVLAVFFAVSGIIIGVLIVNSFKDTKGH